MKFKLKNLFLVLVTAILLLINSLTVFAYENLPNFASGQDPNSALTNVALSTPKVSSITVSWIAKPGDIGVIKYQDVNRIFLKDRSIITMDKTTGSATVTAPNGAMSNTLILVTGAYNGMRYIWYSSITYADGTTETFPVPYMPGAPLAPATPTDNGTGYISWPSVPDATGYTVYDKVNIVGTIPASSNLEFNYNALPAGSHDLSVAATNINGSSTPSGSVRVTSDGSGNATR